MPAETGDQFAANIAAVVSACALVFAGVFAWFTIQNNRTDRVRDSTFRYLDRRDSLEVSGLASWASGIWVLQEGETRDDVVERYLALNEDDKARLYRALNFSEDLSSGYLHHQLDESVFRETFAPILIEDWLEAHALISWLREDDDGNVDRDLWASWETVARQMMRARVRYTTWVSDSAPEDNPPEPPPPTSTWMYGGFPPDWLPRS